MRLMISKLIQVCSLSLVRCVNYVPLPGSHVIGNHEYPAHVYITRQDVGAPWMAPESRAGHHQ